MNMIKITKEEIDSLRKKSIEDYTEKELEILKRFAAHMNAVLKPSGKPLCPYNYLAIGVLEDTTIVPEKYLGLEYGALVSALESVLKYVVESGGFKLVLAKK